MPLIRRRYPLLVATAAALAAAAAGAAPALAGVSPGPVSRFTASFGTARTATATGFALRTAGSPPPAGTELPAVVRQTVRFPKGSAIRFTRRQRCAAPAGVVAAMGARAVCPAASRIGTGVAEGLLNGRRVTVDLGLYAFSGRLRLDAERDGMPLRQGFDGRIAGRTLTLDAPTVGATIAPVRFEIAVAARVLTTPRRCPASRRWTVATTYVGRTALIGGMDAGAAQRRRARVACRAR